MIKLLILAANPRDTDPLRLGQEVRMIESKIRSSSGASRFEIRSAWAVTADELIYQLNSFKPNIVHFVGHGEPYIPHVEDEAIRGCLRRRGQSPRQAVRSGRIRRTTATTVRGAPLRVDVREGP